MNHANANEGSEYPSRSNSVDVIFRRFLRPLATALLLFSLGLVYAEVGEPLASEMVRIPSGTFHMGSPDDEPGRLPDEFLHQAYIRHPFYLGRHEVTWLLWSEVREWAIANGYTDIAEGNNGFAGSDDGSHPVTNVSWWDAIYWCNARSEMTGRMPVYYRSETFDTNSVIRSGFPEVIIKQDANGFRLPTETEWEYASRAGTQSALFNGPVADAGIGCSLDPVVDELAWYCANSNQNTHAAGEKKANAFGLSDMHGNAFEWCWDWYGPYGNQNTANSHVEPEIKTQRVLRGGSWMSRAYQTRSAYRHALAPATVFYNTGFRIAMSDSH